MLITIKFVNVMESKFSKIHPEQISKGGGGLGAPALDPPLFGYVIIHLLFIVIHVLERSN